MRIVAFAFVVAACGGKDSKKETPPPSPPPMGDTAVAVEPAAPLAPDAAMPAVPVREQREAGEPALAGFDFTPMAKALLVVGACGEGPVPAGFSESMVKEHCAVVDKVQAEYTKRWLEVARPWIAAHVPPGLPKRVVYPFAGGDLSTALTVYPDADEITTLSLEPAGDPRALEALNTPAPKTGKAPPALAKALGTVRYELNFLYRVIFSNTINMIEAMRGGALPTQLIFGLSAMKVHGFEVTALRYFKLREDGALAYLTDEDVEKAPAVAPGNAAVRNRLFANAEIRFRKPGGRTQIYRHIQVNLDDDHLRKDPRVLRHLEQKGDVAGMTKAASYLLSWANFSLMRDYLIRHVVWMISDCTGIAPKWGKPVGFEYETYGQFNGPHIGAGNQITKDWEAEFKAEPKRELPFRFGYYDKVGKNHLVLMKRGPSFAVPPATPEVTKSTTKAKATQPVK